MLKVVLDFEPNCAERVNSKYNWSKANIEQMNIDLMEIPWRETLATETVEAAWSRFREVLSETIEKKVPKSGVRTRIRNPWMTREILQLVRKKHRKWKAIKNAATQEEKREYKALEKEEGDSEQD
jgi:hypothetical protein